MVNLALENIEFIKILATSDATILQAGMNDATRTRLDEEIGDILRKYYHENMEFLKTMLKLQLHVPDVLESRFHNLKILN